AYDGACNRCSLTAATNRGFIDRKMITTLAGTRLRGMELASSKYSRARASSLYALPENEARSARLQKIFSRDPRQCARAGGADGDCAGKSGRRPAQSPS